MPIAKPKNTKSMRNHMQHLFELVLLETSERRIGYLGRDSQQFFWSSYHHQTQLLA